MTRARLLAVLCIASACAGDAQRFGVDLIVDATMLASADRDRITQLVVHVDGAEHYDTTLDLTTVAEKSTMRLHYVPLVRAGQLTFMTQARAMDGSAVAVGSSEMVTLADGQTVEAHVQLKSGARRKVGEACTAADDLCDGAGGCVDGVCCGMPCNGACVACNVAGVEGLCVPIAAGTKPLPGHAGCDVDPPASCGKDGFCDGSSNCRKYPLGATCGASTCNVSTNLSVAEGQCDGTGVCVTPAQLPCDPYRCKDATQCWGSCTDASQCTGSPPTCNTAVTPGSCGPKPNGATCAQDAECQSTHCVEPDGLGNRLCCDTACTTTCMSCRIAATRGKCSLVPAGQDPRMQCPAATGAQAACIPGGCDGTAMACKLSPVTTQCRAPTCTVGLNQSSSKVTCSVDGMCPAATSTSCDPYNCGATACKTTCVSDADCLNGSCLGGKCATWGGGYVVNLNASCTSTCSESGNPLASATCSCPPGFTVGISVGSYNDCQPPGTFGTSTINFCQRAARTTTSDWGGAYVVYGAGCGANIVNPYTGMLSCPSDTQTTAFTFYQAACGNNSTLALCTSLTAATVTYAGAYQMDDDVGQGAAAQCRMTNPKTLTCACPAGTTARDILRVLINRAPLTPGIIGSHLYICMP